VSTLSLNKGACPVAKKPIVANALINLVTQGYFSKKLFSLVKYPPFLFLLSSTCLSW